MADFAKHECVSEDALQHLKTYKYSSVDKSFISRYILKHYVRTPLSTHARAVGNRGPDVRHTVECIRRAPAAVDCTESRHVIRLLFHPGERGAPRGLHTGFGRTSALMGILQLRLWHVDVR